MTEQLTNCPKCGFEQPVDQYCANCGVDMTLVPKKPVSVPLMKKPALVAGIAVAVLALTIVGVRATRHAPPAIVQAAPTTETALASEQKTSPPRPRSSQPTAAAQGYAPPAQGPTASLADSTQPMNQNADTAASVAGGAPSVTGGPGTTAGTALTASAKAVTTGSSVDSKPAADAGLTVAFAWAEVSRPWLQEMKAGEPGLHQIPELEEKLRQTAGGYRIVDVTRPRFAAEKPEPFEFARGDRLGVRFEATTASDANLTGTLQMMIRGPDGTMRPPVNASVQMDKGQGAIMTLGGPGSGPTAGVGPSSTGTEIVVLILPRWGADRNP